jgi:hypothetical protein
LVPPLAVVPPELFVPPLAVAPPELFVPPLAVVPPELLLPLLPAAPLGPVQSMRVNPARLNTAEPNKSTLVRMGSSFGVATHKSQWISQTSREVRPKNSRSLKTVLG